MNFEYKNKRSIYVRVFSLIVFCGTVIAMTTCWLLDMNEYRMIALLPFVYCCCYFGCFRNRQFLKSISLSIINISAFFRYVVYPLIIAITVHNGGAYRADKNIVWFLVYELLGVYLIIGIFAKKLNVKNTSNYKVVSAIGIPNALLLFSFPVLVILYPSLITRFSMSPVVQKTSHVSGIVEIIFTMSIWVFFVYFLIRLKSQKHNSIIHRAVSFIAVICIAVYYILFNTISGSDLKRWQIIACGIAMIYIILILFPKYRKIVITGGVAAITVAVVVSSFLKFGITISFGNLIDKYFNLAHFTEYFGGMRNITLALEACEFNANAQGIQSTLTDLFSGVPIVSALFDYEMYATPAIFQRYVNRTDIICPLTAQSIIHFGYVGTPVLAMIMTYLAITFERALRRTDNLYSAYVLIELIVFFSLFMELNTTIILGKLWIRLMFLALQMIDNYTRFKVRWRT